MLHEKVSVLTDHQHPLQSPNTQAVAAATCSGGELAEQGYLDTISEGSDGEPRRTVVWLLKEKPITFSSFEAETISQSEFLKRWNSREWIAEHPDHPIAFMRCYQETLHKLRDAIKKTPTLQIKRGGRTAFIAATANEAERIQILSKLN